MRHTHKKEMDLSTHECTSSCFCHLFTDLCRGRTYFFSIWILSNFILFYYILHYSTFFISFYLNLFFSDHILCWFILFVFLLLILIFFHIIQFNSIAECGIAQLSVPLFVKHVYCLKVTDCNADTRAYILIQFLTDLWALFILCVDMYCILTVTVQLLCNQSGLWPVYTICTV